MAKPAVQLLGGMEIRDGAGGEFRLATRKSRALLAFLAVESARWHSRERLAGLLWSRHAQAQARSSLSQTLYQIRKLETHTGANLIERESDRLRLAQGSVDCDLHRFEAVLASDPLAAAEIYGGDLLADFDLAEEPFVEWLAAKRSHYRARLAKRLLAAAAEAAEAGDVEAGLNGARELLALDPLDENARRLLMRLLARSGNRAEALRQFRVCEEVLAAELGVDPALETRSLAEEIRLGEEARAPPPPVSPDPRLALTDPATESERPVIAVFPFENLSDDADAAWLGHGLADDVIFELSAYRWFRVLARTATFRLAARGRDLDIARRMLGAAYLVSGWVRRAGSRLRVSVELVDCSDGVQLWAGRYERTLDDLFEVEAEIAREVGAAIEPALETREVRRVLGRPPDSLAAYELLQRGHWYANRHTPQDRATARELFEAAAASDPGYACAVAALARVKYFEVLTDVVRPDFGERMRDIRETAEQALRLDPRHPYALRYLGGALIHLGDQEGALVAARRSVELCPSFAAGYSALGFAHDYLGNFDEARAAADETVRLRPHDPVLHQCILARAIADYQTGDYESAERVVNDSQRTNRAWWMSNVWLAVTAAHRGNREQACEAIERIRTDQPGITLKIMLERMRFKNPGHREHLAEGLERAGWYDGP